MSEIDEEIKELITKLSSDLYDEEDCLTTIEVDRMTDGCLYVDGWLSEDQIRKIHNTFEKIEDLKRNKVYY